MLLALLLLAGGVGLLTLRLHGSPLTPEMGVLVRAMWGPVALGDMEQGYGHDWEHMAEEEFEQPDQNHAKEALDIFEGIAANCGDAFDFQEYLSLMAAAIAATTDGGAVIDALGILDRDSDGFASADELRHARTIVVEGHPN